MRVISHIVSILILPFSVTVIIPYYLYHNSADSEFFNFSSINWLSSALGLITLLFGFSLVALTIYLFATIGEGTLAPWDPPKHLLIQGPYAYVRNPMISGVLFIILGESILLNSNLIFIEWLIFFVINSIYFILSEEPNLEKRFGQEYVNYKLNVPRWIPRRNPWKPKT